MELVAYGAQDVYLTGNPQITFFKVVYRRHTNFSIEAIQQSASGNAVIGDSENEASFTIARNGDLIHKVYLTTNDHTTHGIEHGSQIIKEVEISIGGQMIDRYTQEWQDIWNELTIPKCKAMGFKAMTGNVGKSNYNGTDGVSEGVKMVQIPLLFWFCRNPGLALPLIALQYHEVKIDFKFNKNTEILHNEKNINVNYEEFKVDLYIDYIYLDTDERRRFAQVSHEYLIEQIQYLKTNDSTVIDININHPVKELIWTSGGAHHGSYQNAKLVLNGHDRFEPQEEEYFQLRQPYQYHTNIPGYNILYHEGGSLVSSNIDTGVTKNHATPTATKATYGAGATITFHADTPVIPEIGDQLSIMATDSSGKHRGHKVTVTGKTSATNPVLTVSPEITSDHIPPDSYGNDDELYIYIYGGHRTPLPNVSNLEKKINVYSFALKPEEHQPSGTCNFSRIDTAQLIFNTVNGEAFNIYAVNYNVLRIMSGMGGLAYSN